MKLDKYTVGKRYATAIFELAQEANTLPATFEEIKALGLIFDENPDLGEALSDARLSLLQKQPLVDTLKKDFSPFIQHVIQLVFDYRRMADMPFIVDYFETLYDQYNEIVLATVTTAVPLTKAQSGNLGTQFAKRLGMKETVVQNVVKPDILGGVIVEANGQVFDGSVKTKIDRLKKRILNK